MKVQKYLFVVSVVLLALSACTQSEESVSKKESDANLIAGLLALNQANILAAGAASSANASLNAYIEVAGSWNSFTGNQTTKGGDVYISSDSNRKGSWDDNSIPNGFSTTRIIQEFDNSKNTLYYLQTVDAAFNASRFGKFVWTDMSNNTFYFCEIVFGQSSLAAAKASTATADSSKLTTTGCAGFAWSRSERQ
ncbi:MAG: hypothetical protein K8R21_06215 [Leptospira sp.]|nr:hypothetical protein [Leptospira sp.]